MKSLMNVKEEIFLTRIKIITKEFLGDGVSWISRTPGLRGHDLRKLFPLGEDPIFENFVTGHLGTDWGRWHTAEYFTKFANLLEFRCTT